MTQEEKSNSGKGDFEGSRGIFYFERNQNSVLKPTPATSRLIRLCCENNFSPRNAIDLGCGNGRNSLAIANEFGCKITLIDKDPKFLKRAVEQINKAGHQIENARVSGIEKLDLEEFELFDIVLFNYVLQNIHPKHFEYVFSLIHKLTKHYAVVDIYQNPSIYENGVYSYRGAIGWYGFTIDELIAIISSGFDIMWDIGSLAWKGSTTLSYILTPLDEFCTIPFDRYKKKIPVNYLPKRNHRTPLRHSFQRRNPEGNITDKTFRNSYPPCKECISEECSEDSCEILNHWVKSPYLFRNKMKQYGYSNQQVNRDYYRKSYPLCTRCQLDNCLGFDCNRLLTWTNQIKKVKIEHIEATKRDIEMEQINKNCFPSEYWNEINLGIQSLRSKYPSLKQLSHPALVYLASRIRQIPLSLAEICFYFSVKRNKVFKEVSQCQKILNLSFNPISFIDYVNRFSKTLPLSQDNIEVIEKILQHITKNNEIKQQLKGGSSLVTAAAIINYSVQKSQKTMSLSSLSKQCKVSEVSVRYKRKYLQKILLSSHFEI